ncbi:MAG: hypothetical protein KJ674_03365 [Nanoarchaeota archaeon]|nr:hypothetical protein [Nanoarchaeota archaeon]
MEKGQLPIGDLLLFYPKVEDEDQRAKNVFDLIDSFGLQKHERIGLISKMEDLWQINVGYITGIMKGDLLSPQNNFIEFSPSIIIGKETVGYEGKHFVRCHDLFYLSRDDFGESYLFNNEGQLVPLTRSD